MTPRNLIPTFLTVTLLLLGSQPGAAQLCDFVAQPPLSFSFDPETGLFTATGPVVLNGIVHPAEFQIALLGALEVGDDGSLQRVLLAHSWRILDNGLHLEFFGEAKVLSTDLTGNQRFTERADLAAVSKRYDTGVIFVEGEANLAAGTATGSVFGKLCRSPRLRQSR